MATRHGPFVGIDVSKDWLDMAELGERQMMQMDNTQEGIKELVAKMQELQPELIVVEATGGYQRAVVEALFWAGLAVAVVNPPPHIRLYDAEIATANSAEDSKVGH